MYYYSIIILCFLCYHNFDALYTKKEYPRLTIQNIREYFCIWDGSIPGGNFLHVFNSSFNMAKRKIDFALYNFNKIK